MKYPVKYQNQEELNAIIRLISDKSSETNFHSLLVQSVLIELQAKLIKKTLNCALSNIKKGKINLTKAEVIAIYFNYNPRNHGPYEQGMYNKSITPLLHVISSAV